MLTQTSNSLKEETCLIVNPLYFSGRHDSLNLAGAIIFGLFPVNCHYVEFGPFTDIMQMPLRIRLFFI